MASVLYATLPCTHGLGAERLAEIMNLWRAKAVGDSLTEVLRKQADTPFGEAIEPVVRAAQTLRLLMPLGEEPADSQQDMQFLVAHDKCDRAWANLFADETTLSRYVPPGTPYLAMPFAEIFSLIDKEPAFAGLQIIADGESFPIPRELFGDVVRILEASKND